MHPSSTTIGGLAELAADLQRRLFTPAAPYGGSTRLGVEIELLPIESDTGRIAPIAAGDGVSTLRLLRRHGEPLLWEEQISTGRVSTFHLPDLGSLGFGPGGQLIYSSPPCGSASELRRRAHGVLGPLAAAAPALGIELLFAGADPHNTLDAAPLQLFTARNCRMADYFSRLGPDGGRMMRQTAGLHVTVDLGERPLARWRVLNAAAPVVTAIFANSPRYAGRATGRPSQRAHIWRRVDASRTGLPYGEGAPIAAYLEFALCAPDCLRETAAGQVVPFVGWIDRGVATLQQWSAHLTTLFPEVRPRGGFEVRSPDTIPLPWLAAPLALIGGLVYDDAALAAADRLLGDPDLALLRAAAARGLGDPRLAALARDLFAIALEGCVRLGPRFIQPADLEVARGYCGRYTARGRAPADDWSDAATPA
jgi:glutamate--cysteine ligase